MHTPLHSRVALFVLLAACSLLWLACDDSSPDRPRGELCGTNEDCGPGSHCAGDGRCLVVTSCEDDSSCAFGSSCAGGECRSVLTAETHQAPGRQDVDILMVIDNGPAMCEVHGDLLFVMENFVDIVAGAGVDANFAVITPDMLDLIGGSGQFRRDAGEYVITCGWPNDFTNCFERSSGVIRSADFLLDSTASRAAMATELGCLIRTGVGSRNGPSMGLEAMRQALSNPSQAAEFLRPGARLAVVFVVGSNDCSDGTFGAQPGPVYSSVVADGNDLACEYQRNIEDSCRHVFPGSVGDFVSHEGREAQAFTWCVEGDRPTVETLADQLSVQCPPGGCANGLTPRSEYYDFLVDLVAEKNGHGDRERAAAYEIGVVTLGVPDGGNRYDPPDEPTEAFCDGGTNTYRYELFARMFPFSQAVQGCGGNWPRVFGETDPILGQPVDSICLERRPQTCDPALGEAACSPGAVCQEQFEGLPESYFTCTDAVLRVQADLGAGPIDLPFSTGYRVDYQSQRCLDLTGSPIEVRLVDTYDASATITVEYLPEP